MYNFYHLKISTSLQILFINVTKDNLDLKIYTRFQNYASLLYAYAWCGCGRDLPVFISAAKNTK